MKPILLVIKDKDHNHSIVDIMVCENEYTAQRVQNTLKNHPRYSLPCYYSEIQFPEIIMESSLSCPTCNHVNGYHSNNSMPSTQEEYDENEEYWEHRINIT